MKIWEILFVSVLFPILTINCRKEYSCENCQLRPNLKGNWKLLHFDVKVLGSTTYLSPDGPWMSSAEYSTLTTKNAGIYNIDDHHITVTGLSCESLPAPVTETIQRDGNRTVRQNGGFGWFIYPYDIVVKYQMIGADSLYFPDNGLSFMPDAQSWVIWHPQGIFVWLMMNLIMLPISNVPGLKFQWLDAIKGLSY